MRQSVVVAALAAMVALAGGTRAFAQATAPGAWSPTDCQACHEKALGPAFQQTSHAKLADSCAKCHPNVAEHVKAQMSGEANAPVPSLKKVSAQQINETCLSCHEKARQANYNSSMHARRNVACTTCHSVHSPKSPHGQLKTARDSETCFTCHKQQRAMSMRASHHPVREGKIACSSCHNPHDGNSPKMLNADSVNELCYQCHTEKRGPMAFEHAPVREDCASCHEPHGSNHERLLKQKLPNLCYNCHFSSSGHFGTGEDNLLTPVGGVAVAPPGAPNGYPTVNSRFAGRSCRNCHVKLHGSNHPAGAFFLR
jgi:DmsE family decaheme c-type cytochrome